MSASAAETFSGWLEAFNDSDPAALETFAAERSDVARGAHAWARYRRVAGPLKLLKLEKTGADGVEAIVHDRWDLVLRIKLAVADERPDRIAALEAAQIPPPDYARPARMDWPDLKRALEAKLAEGVAKDWMFGAIMASRDGEPLFEAAYGEADRERQIPNTLETRFRMGSMNKMITGVAVLQLDEADQVDLDDPVGRHLPDYPSRAFAGKVTVGHLLNHTGGAGDFFGPEFDEHRLELCDLKDYVALFGHRDPEFEPGSQHKYANYGFMVLGRIIEAVSGQSYDDYVEANVFAVAGMTATGALAESVEVSGRAVGYMDSPEGLVRNDVTLPVRGTSAGGGYSTVGDLVRFAEALTAGRLLGAERLGLILNDGVETAPGAKYGMGFGKVSNGGERWLGHSGGAPGKNGILRIYPAAGYVVAALSNGDPPQANSLGEFIGQRLPLA
jgi:D-alanyl-D-alanine carboxypeptidase